MSELTDLLARGTTQAGALARTLGISPATLMRRAREDADRVVRIGRGRATHYGLRRPIPALGTAELPLYRIAPDGQPAPVGQLIALASDETAWLPAGLIHFGLPPEVHDMRPQGFLGRAFPRQHGDLPVPPRITDWSDEHVLIALARRGEDAPGNLIVGDESFSRWHRWRPEAIGRADFPDVARAATAGEPVGSSAGGEQPKFGAYAEGRHVLVKFAPRGNEVATRWQDLIALEHLALTVLREAGIAAARSELLDTDSHRFLEIERFDRVGERGRRPVLTLAGAHRHPNDSWARAAQRMHEARAISAEDAERLQFYDAFGQLIANTDRHHYNVVFFPEHDETTAGITRYAVAPAFDQLPMMYAPGAGGTLPEREFIVPTPTASTWTVWPRARTLAIEFWERAETDARISASLREACGCNADTLRAI